MYIEEIEKNIEKRIMLSAQEWRTKMIITQS